MAQDKWIIYTCGVPEINEAVQRVLFEKGYEISNLHNFQPLFYFGPQNNGWGWGDVEGWEFAKNYKEITFRELCELTPIHNEEEALAKYIANRIKHRIEMYLHKKVSDINLCKARQLVEKKLGV